MAENFPQQPQFNSIDEIRQSGKLDELMNSDVWSFLDPHKTFDLSTLEYIIKNTISDNLPDALLDELVLLITSPGPENLVTIVSEPGEEMAFMLTKYSGFYTSSTAESQAFKSPDDDQAEPTQQAVGTVEQNIPDSFLGRDWGVDPPADWNELYLFSLQAHTENKKLLRGLRLEALIRFYYINQYGTSRSQDIILNEGKLNLAIHKEIGAQGAIPFNCPALGDKIREAFQDDDSEKEIFFNELTKNHFDYIVALRNLGVFYHNSSYISPDQDIDERLQKAELDSQNLEFSSVPEFQVFQEDIVTEAKTFLDTIKNSEDSIGDVALEIGGGKDRLDLINNMKKCLQYYHSFDYDNSPESQAVQNNHEVLLDLVKYFCIPEPLNDSNLYSDKMSLLTYIIYDYKILHENFINDNLSEVEHFLNLCQRMITEVSALYSKPVDLYHKDTQQILVDNLPKYEALIEKFNNVDDFSDLSDLEQELDELINELNKIFESALAEDYEAYKELINEKIEVLRQNGEEFITIIDSFHVGDNIKTTYKDSLQVYFDQIDSFDIFDSQARDTIESIQSELLTIRQSIISQYYQDAQTMAEDVYGQTYVAKECARLDANALQSIVDAGLAENLEEVDIINNPDHQLQYQRFLADNMAQMPNLEGKRAFVSDFLTNVRNGLNKISDQSAKNSFELLIKNYFAGSKEFKQAFDVNMDIERLTEDELKSFISLVTREYKDGKSFMEFLEYEVVAYDEYAAAVEIFTANLNSLREKLHVNRSNHHKCEQTKKAARLLMQRYLRDGQILAFERDDSMDPNADAKNQLGDVSLDLFTAGLPEQQGDRDKHNERLIKLGERLRELKDNLDADINRARDDREQVNLEHEVNIYDEKIHDYLSSGGQLFDTEHLSLMKERQEYLDKLQDVNEYAYATINLVEYEVFIKAMDAYQVSGYDTGWERDWNQYVREMEKYHYPTSVLMMVHWYGVFIYHAATQPAPDQDDIDNRIAGCEKYINELDDQESTTVLHARLKLYEQITSGNLYNPEGYDEKIQEIDRIRQILADRKADYEFIHEDVKKEQELNSLEDFSDRFKELFSEIDEAYAAKSQGKSDFNFSGIGLLSIDDGIHYLKVDVRSLISQYRTIVKSYLDIDMSEADFRDFDGKIKDQLNFFMDRRAAAEAQLMDFNKNIRGKNDRDLSNKRKWRLMDNMSDASEFYNKFAEIWMQGRLSRYVESERMLTDKVIQKRLDLHIQRGGRDVSQLQNVHERIFKPGTHVGESESLPWYVRAGAFLGATPTLSYLGAAFGGVPGAIGGAALGAGIESLVTYLRAEGYSLDDLVEEVPEVGEVKKNKSGFKQESYRSFDKVIANLKYGLDEFLEDLKRDPQGVEAKLEDNLALQRVQQIQLLRRYHLVSTDHPLVQKAMQLHRTFVRELEKIEIQHGLAYAYTRDDVEHFGKRGAEKKKALERKENVEKNLESLIKKQMRGNNQELEKRLDSLANKMSEVSADKNNPYSIDTKSIKRSTKSKRRRTAIMKGLITGSVNAVAATFGAAKIGGIGSFLTGTAINTAVHKHESLWESFKQIFIPKKTPSQK